MTTAGAIIIGDEILTGKVQDQNSIVLAKAMFERGVRLKRIHTISDHVDEIVRTVQEFSKTYDFVFTSGGIGPTHDDKTYASIAKAFDRPLSYHQVTLDKLHRHMQERYPGIQINEARRKMAYLPTPCETLFIEGLWVPVVVVENVYIFPGVPRLFEFMIDGIKERFSGEVLQRVVLFTNKSEGDIADVLETMQNAHLTELMIGSYPHYDSKSYRVMVTIEGTNAELVQETALQIRNAIDGFLETA